MVRKVCQIMFTEQPHIRRFSFADRQKRQHLMAMALLYSVDPNSVHLHAAMENGPNGSGSRSLTSSKNVSKSEVPVILLPICPALLMSANINCLHELNIKTGFQPWQWLLDLITERPLCYRGYQIPTKLFCSHYLLIVISSGLEILIPLRHAICNILPLEECEQDPPRNVLSLSWSTHDKLDKSGRTM